MFQPSSVESLGQPLVQSDQRTERCHYGGIRRLPRRGNCGGVMMAEAQSIASKLGIVFRHTIEERILGAEKSGRPQDLDAPGPGGQICLKSRRSSARSWSNGPRLPACRPRSSKLFTPRTELLDQTTRAVSRKRRKGGCRAANFKVCSIAISPENCGWLDLANREAKLAALAARPRRRCRRLPWYEFFVTDLRSRLPSR